MTNVNIVNSVCISIDRYRELELLEDEFEHIKSSSTYAFYISRDYRNKCVYVLSKDDLILEMKKKIKELELRASEGELLRRKLDKIESNWWFRLIKSRIRGLRYI